MQYIILLKSLAIDQLIWQILNNKSKLKKPKKYFLVDYSDSNYTKGVIIFLSDTNTCPPRPMTKFKVASELWLSELMNCCRNKHYDRNKRLYHFYVMHMYIWRLLLRFDTKQRLPRITKVKLASELWLSEHMNCCRNKHYDRTKRPHHFYVMHMYIWHRLLRLGTKQRLPVNVSAF